MSAHLQSVIGDVALVWLITLFTFTGTLKLVDYGSSVAGIARYDAVVGRTVARSAAYALPWVEVAAAAAIAVSRTRTAGGLAAVLLGMTFAVVGGISIRTKLEVGCGCGGARSGDRIGTQTVARAAVIVTAGIVVATMGQHTTLRTPAMAALMLAASIPALFSKLEFLWSKRARPNGHRNQSPIVTTVHGD